MCSSPKFSRVCRIALLPLLYGWHFWGRASGCQIPPPEKLVARPDDERCLNFHSPCRRS